MAHVSVPSQKEIELALLERKKQELLERYASDGLIREENDVKNMLGMSSEP